MSGRVFAMPEDLDWKHAYLAAIQENDRTRILGLIEDARAKLTARLLELKTSGVVLCDEVEAIDDAFYLLQALKSSLLYRGEQAS